MIGNLTIYLDYMNAGVLRIREQVPLHANKEVIELRTWLLSVQVSRVKKICKYSKSDFTLESNSTL
ncbi:MAG: hypothetical protein ACTSWN_11665 [Promethearchaeota archaeon]